MKENRHSILIEMSGEEDALCEIIRWGEACWWPKGSMMRFIRSGTGPVQKGTRYRQKVLFPFAPSWDVEVVTVTDGSITRRFLNGMFKGQETVSLKKIGPAVEVNYVMNYEVNGLINRFFWRFIFQRLHNINIEQILSNLKDFLEKKRKG